MNMLAAAIAFGRDQLPLVRGAFPSAMAGSAVLFALTTRAVRLGGISAMHERSSCVAEMGRVFGGWVPRVGGVFEEKSAQECGFRNGRAGSLAGITDADAAYVSTASSPCTHCCLSCCLHLTCNFTVRNSRQSCALQSSYCSATLLPIFLASVGRVLQKLLNNSLLTSSSVTSLLLFGVCRLCKHD
jgi:hypothetical protein